MRKILLKLSIILGSMLFSLNSYSATLKEVLAVTNQIIMLRFEDGVIDYHNLGQERESDRVFLDAGGRLNQNLAQNINSYTIFSSDDPAYNSALRPVRIGYNVRVEQTWQIDAFSEGRPTDARTYYVYIFLPQPMQNGKSYTVNTSNLGVGSNSITLNYQTSISRSEAVHVNNLGYVPSATKKYGYVYLWMGDAGGLLLNNNQYIDASVGKKFRLRRVSDNSIAYTSTSDYQFRKAANNSESGQGQNGFLNSTPNGNYLGSDVYECDFSSFNEPGEYRLEVDGVGCSFPFAINNEIYRDPFYWTMKSLYENRAGIALSKPWSQYDRPVTQRPGQTPGFKIYYSSLRHYDFPSRTNDGDVGRDKAAVEAYERGEINIWGWYQDAGDWDHYYNHTKIPAFLLFLYEINPEKFNGFNLNIPESVGQPQATTLPDLLDEARWELRFYKRIKDELLAKGFGTGGVGGGRVFGDLWDSEQLKSENGKGSWQDQRKWYCTGEDPWNTYIYAALAAHFSYILSSNNLTDPEAINWRKEAEDAYNWAKNNTRAGDEVRRLQYNLGMYRMYAAAALFRLTGNSAYNTDYIQQANTVQLSNGTTGLTANFGEMQQDEYQYFGIMMYELAARVQPSFDASTRTKVQGAIRSSADFVANPCTWGPDARACRWGGNFFKPMGIGQGISPDVADAIFAYQLNGGDITINNCDKGGILSTIYTTCDYALGTNPLNTTYVTGLGERYPQQIFHMDSWYLTPTQEVKKGIVPYGAVASRALDLGGAEGFYGPYKEFYALDKAYPAGDARPGHERFMPSRSAPLTNEFTVHQTSIMAAFHYGFLWALTGQGSNTPTPAPLSISIVTPQTNQTFAPGATINLSVQVTGNVQEVTYWYDTPANPWNWIATTTNAPNYSYNFTLPANLTTGNYKIIARATTNDNRSVDTEVTFRVQAPTSPVNCAGTGGITYERYENIPGISVNDLYTSSRWLTGYDYTTTLTSFEAPENVCSNCGVRMTALICPPETGNYTFWIAGDDHAELWISEDYIWTSNERVAYHEGWTFSKEWNKYPTQKGVVYLEAGKQYIVEANMKEVEGLDNLAVGWRKPGDGEGLAPVEVVPGSVLIPIPSIPNANLASLNQSVANFAAPERLVYGYPNPFSNEDMVLHFDLPANTSTRVSILNGYGEEVFNQVLLVPASQEITLPNNLFKSSGIYMVKVSGNGINEMQRVIKAN